jgi:hypothetical protein
MSISPNYGAPGFAELLPGTPAVSATDRRGPLTQHDEPRVDDDDLLRHRVAVGAREVEKGLVGIADLEDPLHRRPLDEALTRSSLASPLRLVLTKKIGWIVFVFHGTQGACSTVAACNQRSGER